MGDENVTQMIENSSSKHEAVDLIPSTKGKKSPAPKEKKGATIETNIQHFSVNQTWVYFLQHDATSPFPVFMIYIGSWMWWNMLVISVLPSLR